MHYLVRYRNHHGWLYSKTFKSEQECDAWITANSAPDVKPGGNPWLPEEQGGEIGTLVEYLRIRDPKDLEGHTVSFFKSPAQRTPLAQYRVAHVAPAHEETPHDGFLKITGLPADAPEGTEPTDLAVIKGKNLGDALADLWYHGEEGNRPWVEALFEGAPQDGKEPERKPMLIMRPDWQTDKLKEYDLRDSRQRHIFREVRKSPIRVISVYYTVLSEGEGKKDAFALNYEYGEETLRKLFPDDDTLEKEVSAFVKALTQKEEPKKPEKAGSFFQGSLFPEFDTTPAFSYSTR